VGKGPPWPRGYEGRSKDTRRVEGRGRTEHSQAARTPSPAPFCCTSAPHGTGAGKAPQQQHWDRLSGCHQPLSCSWGHGDRKAGDGTLPCIPLPHSIHVLLLMDPPVFLPISSAPSLPVGALAAPDSLPFPTQMSWGSAEARPSHSQSHSPPRPAGSEARLGPGDCRAKLGKGCGVGADPATALGWGGQTLPSHIFTSFGLRRGGSTRGPDPHPPLPTRSTLASREDEPRKTWTQRKNAKSPEGDVSRGKPGLEHLKG